MVFRLLVLFVAAGSFAWAQEPPPAWKKCGTEIAWMSDKRPLKDNNQGGALVKTDVDLEELWSDVKAKAAETKRPILWYIPKVAGSHMYRGAILNHYMDAAIWSDEAVVGLVNRRFVPLRAACAKELADQSGVKRWRVVEPAIVIFDADGKELHYIQRIRTFNADFIAAALRAALDKASPAAPPDGASGEELMAGGWFDAAAKKLPGSPLSLAELRRREGKFDEALAILVRAASQGANADELEARRGRVLLSAGRIAEAKASLSKSKSPEATYYLAHAERLSGHDDTAKEIWTKLAASAGDTRWGWRSASNTTLHDDKKAFGPGALGYEDVIGSAAPAAGATTTKWERSAADLDDIAKRAVAWLLRNQSANGSWNDSRYAYWPSPEIQPNVHMAVTGLACSALLEWRAVDPERIDAALALGEKYLLDETKMARGKNEESYADAYRLLYLARKQEKLADEAAKKLGTGRMNGLVVSLAAIQDKTGFWSHEYFNPFVTAAVLQVLQRAQRAGATVDDAILTRGGAALKTTRDDKGRQAYGAGTRGSNDSNSSGRNAMCEAALLEVKATDKESFEAAMDQFWAFLDRRENVRVCDFHSDQELAGFFFFNNFYHTMEAVPLLEAKSRERAIARATEHLAKIPEIDGSFIDSHEMGKSYGTAAALLSLKHCMKK
ncbi:MAG TPA: hypothetical protein VJU16_00210 [Planctomycetota bacterium]|nr:hypothetical protein [Planctomycetota bacterium]